jgi:hypothetical protein
VRRDLLFEASEQPLDEFLPQHKSVPIILRIGPGDLAAELV